ncbi:MAG TPA: YggS family pyridoxal phosphate-dependent enzyme, partial [Syntrophales bacterium]|nr:YggS family pyridoxal phosphate-dependent enzyme [Syntrophales bacterium]
IIAAAALENISVEGLMTIPPWFPDPEKARPYFAALRELKEKIEKADIPRVHMRELSMGMTDDYEVAVEEGATIIRIGRGIFGERVAKK